MATTLVCNGNRNNKTAAELLGSANVTAAPYPTTYFNALRDIKYTRLTAAEMRAKVNSMSDILEKEEVRSALTSNSYAGSNAVDGIGILTTSSITLENIGFPAVPDKKSIKETSLYNAKVSIYCDEILDEYCLRYSIYKFGLTALLENILNNKSSTDIPSQQAIVGQLNTHCQNVLKVMHSISRHLQTQTSGFQQQIQTLNSVLDNNVDKIKNYNTVLSNADIESDVTKRMAEYTYEKNKYSTNLLALYGGLNIVALAMLVYIYRS